MARRETQKKMKEAFKKHKRHEKAMKRKELAALKKVTNYDWFPVARVESSLVHVSQQRCMPQLPAARWRLKCFSRVHLTRSTKAKLARSHSDPLLTVKWVRS
jgi:hypothetical protein